MSNNLPLECDQNTLERLAFIKYLYNVAVEQSRMPEPMCWTSILTFHDAIEMFLQLVCVKLSIDTKNLQFMLYWKEIQKHEKGYDLTQKVSCEQLNTARVNFKHHGTPPARLAIEGYRATATNFFNENTQIVFGMSFSELSLLYIVGDPEIKSLLHEAENFINERDYEKAIEKIVRSFKLTIKKTLHFEKSVYYKDPFKLIELPYPDEFGIVESVKKSIEPLITSVKLLCLGIDYKKYAKYYSLSPDENEYGCKDGVKLFYDFPSTKESTSISNCQARIPNYEETIFCFNFVIESYIIINEFDIRLNEYKDPSIL